MEFSEFFRSHEVIGSSLLFVHDRHKSGIWLIDFAKTIELPDNLEITHTSKWKVGNHEDGYLIGINNLIEIFTEVYEKQQQEQREKETQILNQLAERIPTDMSLGNDVGQEQNNNECKLTSLHNSHTNHNNNCEPLNSSTKNS